MVTLDLVVPEEEQVTVAHNSLLHTCGKVRASAVWCHGDGVVVVLFDGRKGSDRKQGLFCKGCVLLSLQLLLLLPLSPSVVVVVVVIASTNKTVAATTLVIITPIISTISNSPPISSPPRPAPPRPLHILTCAHHVFVIRFSARDRGLR